MHHHQPFSSQIATTMNPQFPENEHLNCPRCDSSNTKFCYYNNYNLSQPRHFCKNCRRYWTKGGTLRNIPVGGGTRKINKRSTISNKRPADSSPPTSPPATTTTPSPSPPPPSTSDLAESKPESLGILGYGDDDDDQMKLDGGSSNSVMKLNHGMQFGSFVDGLRSSLGGGSEEDGNGLIGTPATGVFEKKHLSLNDYLIGTPATGVIEKKYLSLNDDLIGTPATGVIEKKYLSLNDDDNEGGNGWPNLSIFTPGSNLH